MSFMEGIAQMFAALFAPNDAQAAVPPAAVPQRPAAFVRPSLLTPAIPLPASAFRYEKRLPAIVSLSPMERATSQAWEAGDTNRAELERAMASERRTPVMKLLLQEHRNLFGGSR